MALRTSDKVWIICYVVVFMVMLMQVSKTKAKQLFIFIMFTSYFLGDVNCKI